MGAELPSSEEEVQALLQSAVSSRASHIRKEAETITMTNVRRLLESDLGLEKSALDVHKVFIRQLVDEVLLSPANDEGQDEAAAVLQEAPKRKKMNAGQKVKEEIESPDLECEGQQEKNHVKERKKKKRKKDVVKKEISNSTDDDENNGGNHGEISGRVDLETPKKQSQREPDENGNGSQSEVSEEDNDVYERQKSKKALSKNVNVKPVQNMKIEHLKRVIKACGLTIPPQIYKRANQQPEEKRDKVLIKELQEILHRRGLSSDPSEKEIKAVKKKIAREKDMEGIETTNIILEPRGRRATSQLFAPVYKPPPAEYDSEQDDDGEENEEEDSDDADSPDDEEKDFADDSENSD